MTLQHRVLPEVRRRRLYDLLHAGRGVRIIEAHSGLSALVGSRAVFDAPGGEHLEFDGLWGSSLTNSAIKGLPDVELYTLERRVETIEEIAGVTNKPIIVDADTGGIDPNFDYLCSRLEALGVSAVVVEDKRYPKKNILLAVADHELEDPDVFCRKLSHARGVCLSEQFMII